MSNVGMEQKEILETCGIKFIEYPLLKYFHLLVKNIQSSAKYEIFQFLELKYKEIGKNIYGASTSSKNYQGFLLPENSSSYPDGYKIVSFYVDPESLLSKSYVLRKNGWQKPDLSYQRILEKKKISEMRKYLTSEKRVYLGNIIATLPSNTSLLNSSNSESVPDKLPYSEQNVTQPVLIQLPDSFNTIGLIDGQHRVYSYHEGNDAYEKGIEHLRVKQNLLVTGIIYPPHISKEEQIQFEGNLFLEINNKQVKVKSVLTQEIELVVKPFSSTSIARAVLTKLNTNNGALQHKIQEHTFDNGAKLKASSIVSYGLKPLIKLTGNDSIFHIWEVDNSKKEKLQALQKEKSKISAEEKKLLDEYIEFCVTKINIFLNAVKSNSDHWKINDEKKVLTTTSINGFFRCLRLVIENKHAINLDSLKATLKLIDNFNFIEYKSSSLWGKMGEEIYKTYFQNLNDHSIKNMNEHEQTIKEAETI